MLARAGSFSDKKSIGKEDLKEKKKEKNKY